VEMMESWTLRHGMSAFIVAVYIRALHQLRYQPVTSTALGLLLDMPTATVTSQHWLRLVSLSLTPSYLIALPMLLWGC
jgi:hypothetical protein